MGINFRLVGATGTHKGDRAYQQDRVVLLSHPHANGCVLGVVADGMGGRSGGRKAADQVILTAQQVFERFSPATDDPVKTLQRIVDEAHLVIRLIAVSSEQEPHSTMAAFLVTPLGDCFWIHVGDSRIYHFHQGEVIHRTTDHSYVQSLVDKGAISAEEADSHPQSNILLSCLGTEADPPASARSAGRLQPGDCIMACSDGLWHYVPQGELAAALTDAPVRDGVRSLTATARRRARGGGDNLSIVVVRMEAPGAEPAVATPPGRP
jgi:serine/threonine protein phosphatase PrpC